MPTIREILNRYFGKDYLRNLHTGESIDMTDEIAQAEADIIKAIMEKLPKEKTEDDFLNIVNPERQATLGEFTYRKNGSWAIREFFKGYNQALSNFRKNLGVRR